MKKIMFNDKYGLTDAVLQGRKTMTQKLEASDYRCCECGKAAVAFYPCVDPDIPSHPYCADCLGKAMVNMAEAVWPDDKVMQHIAKEQAKKAVEKYKQNKK